MLDVVDEAVKLVTGLALGGKEGWNTLSDDLADSEPEANVITLSGYLEWKGGYTPWVDGEGSGSSALGRHISHACNWTVSGAVTMGR